MITPEDLRVIREHAEQTYPFEACGFITPNGVMRCSNVHPDARSNFSIPASEVRHGERLGILGVYHSHCDAPATPSQADNDRAQYNPYLIVEVRLGSAVHVNAYAVGEFGRKRLWLLNDLLP
jgi:proteasome lid subunit RPN8/RPN11